MSGSVRSRWAAVGAAVAVTLGGGVGLARAAGSDGGDQVLVNLPQPCRLMDLRPAPDQVGSRGTPLGAGEEYVVSAHGAQGNCNIPSDATALLMNVTALNATLLTNLRFFPAGTTLPLVSSLNPAPGEPPTPNAVTTGLDEEGRFVVFNAFGDVRVIADVTGYYVGHDHDDRYYTKTEIDETFADKEHVEDSVTPLAAALDALVLPTAIASIDAESETYRPGPQGVLDSPFWDGSAWTLATSIPFDIEDGDVAVVTPSIGCVIGDEIHTPTVASFNDSLVVRFAAESGGTLKCGFSVVVYDTQADNGTVAM